MLLCHIAKVLDLISGFSGWKVKRVVVGKEARTDAELDKPHDPDLLSHLNLHLDNTLLYPGARRSNHCD